MGLDLFWTNEQHDVIGVGETFAAPVSHKGQSAFRHHSNCLESCLPVSATDAESGCSECSHCKELSSFDGTHVYGKGFVQIFDVLGGVDINDFQGVCPKTLQRSAKLIRRNASALADYIDSHAKMGMWLHSDGAHHANEHHINCGLDENGYPKPCDHKYEE